MKDGEYMASTNKTTNYNLNQWTGTDYLKREDLNSDNEIIDAALKENADSLETHLNEKATQTTKGHVQVDGTTITSNNGVISAVQQKKPVGAKMYQYNNSWGGF